MNYELRMIEAFGNTVRLNQIKNYELKMMVFLYYIIKKRKALRKFLIHNS